MIEEVEQCLEFLTVLKTDYVRVATKTNALHEACENLLEDQVTLADLYVGFWQAGLGLFVVIKCIYAHTRTRLTSPFFRDYLGEPVPER